MCEMRFANARAADCEGHLGGGDFEEFVGDGGLAQFVVFEASGP